MCILLTTTEHPDYPLIILSNRDEYFVRPTQPASFRPLLDCHLLTPLDKGRIEQGTWIGVNTKGKFAALVNYREEDVNIISEVSRGILPIDYLSSPLSDNQWYDNIETSLGKRVSDNDGGKVPLGRIGGFSLVYGNIGLDNNGRTKKLNIISNRGDKGTLHDPSSNDAICQESTFGISNSLYYNPWNKVTQGKSLLKNLIENAVESHYLHQQLIESCFQVLSTDTFDRSVMELPTFKPKLKELQNSIFIPPLSTNLPEENVTSTIGHYYGTRTQTVIALHRSGSVHYYERNLNDTDDITKNKPNSHHYSFDIE